MLPGDFLPPQPSGPTITYEWVGTPGASPSVKLVDGRPAAWNPLSGVDRTFDHVWAQSDQPPSGTTHEWTDGEHISASVKRFDGVEVDRNLSINSSHEITQTSHLAMGSRARYSGLTAREDRVVFGQYSGMFTWDEGATEIQTVVQQQVPVESGQWVALSIYVTGASNVNRTHVAGIISELGNNGGNHLTHHYVGDYEWAGQNDMTRLEYVAQVTSASVDQARVGLRFSGTPGPRSNYSSPSSFAYLDGWKIKVADTEADARAGISDYFDGNFPDDRENDLWYDADGVPHFWLKGWGWAVLEDERLTPVPEGFLNLHVIDSFDGDTPDVIPPLLPRQTDVRFLDTYAIVAGTRREIESVSLDREIANDLPEQIVGGGGLAGGTGTIVWSTEQDVEAREVSPWADAWSGWPPEAGDRVQVYVTDGTTSWPRFTGRIDKTTGVVGGRLQSTLVDFRDQMRAMTTRSALLRYYTPLQDATPYRLIGLDYWFMLTRALRYVNIYNTPPTAGDASLQAPMQGSSWPVVGTLEESLGPGPQTNPRFHRAPWGQSVGSINAKYIPPSWGQVSVTAPLQIALQVAPDHAGTAHVQVHYGESRIRVRVWETRALTAYWNDEAVVDLSAAQMSNATTVVLLVKGSSWTFRTDSGQEATGTRSRSGSATKTHIWVRGTEDARFAGVGVDSPNSAGEWRALSFTPNMTYETSNLISHMDMSASHENEDVADLVDEICKATLTGAWFDEMGILRFVPSDRLRARTPVQTLTSLDDITELEWETSLLSIRSRVNVTWQSALVSRTRLQRKELYRASSATLGSGDEIEVFAQPDSDVEWFGVDWDPQRLNDSNWGSYGAPGSKMGVYYTNSDNEELRTSSQTTTIRVERLGINTLKITHIAGSYSSGVEGNLGVSETDTVLREKHKGDNLPVIRGRAEGRWVDELTTRTLSTGYGDAELTHDLGPWGVQFAADQIADFLAERVQRAEPTIRRFAVTYDPRRQLGDVVTLDVGILGVQLRALIVGISESHNPGAHTQQLTVRIIDATTTREVTYNDLAQAWAGRNYDALQTVWANLTYNDFTNNPLEGT